MRLESNLAAGRHDEVPRAFGLCSRQAGNRFVVPSADLLQLDEHMPKLLTVEPSLCCAKGEQARAVGIASDGLPSLHPGMARGVRQTAEPISTLALASISGSIAAGHL